MSKKSSVQITVTPLILQALENAVETMKSYANTSSLVQSSTRDDQVGEICRTTLSNLQSHRAILKQLIGHIEENLNPQEY